MASTIHFPNTNINNNHHFTFSENTRPRKHSFGQVSLPNQTHTETGSVFSSTASARHSFAASVIAIRTVNSAMEMKSRLSRLWKEIQGCNNWEDLVEPLHPVLRREIIRYGQLVTACYKAFDLDPNSKRYLNCKFGKKNLLRQVGMENSGYQVTKYIYATPDVTIPIHSSDSCGRWIGYVAVSDDDSVRRLGRRDIVVTFRGTVTNPEWIANFMSSLTPARLDPHNPRPEVKVESGFLSLYTSDESDDKFGLGSCREQLLSEVSRLLNRYRGEELSITLAGHSMGSSLALLLAYDIAELGLNTNTNTNDDDGDRIPIAVFSFGGPRVGNSGFKLRCEELGVKVLRIVNVNDPITKMPGVVFNENFRVLGGKYSEFLPWTTNFSCYEHVGVELVLDFFNMQNPSCVHDLETYMISLLKSPKNRSPHTQNHNIGEATHEFIQRAKDQLLFAAQNLNVFPWRNAANNMVN